MPHLGVAKHRIIWGQSSVVVSKPWGHPLAHQARPQISALRALFPQTDPSAWSLSQQDALSGELHPIQSNGGGKITHRNEHVHWGGMRLEDAGRF